MNKGSDNAPSGGLLIESVFCVVIVGAVIYTLWRLIVDGYLPQPFFFEPNDTFADWFNTAYWARDHGTYDVWGSLYPPISFVFLRLFGIDHCYPKARIVESSPGLAPRECDWLGIGSIFALYILDVILIYLLFRKYERRNRLRAILRTICLGLGWPLLDGLERGNLVLVSFACFLLAAGPLLKSARFRYIFAGIAINFKVYLIAAFVPLVVKRKWIAVEGVVLSTIFVYALSFAILGRGTPGEVVNNIMNWSSMATVNPLDLWFSTTYNALYSLVTTDVFPVTLLVGSRWVDVLATGIPLLQHFTQLFIVLAIIVTGIRPEAVANYRVINLGLMLALITSESGGYTPVYFSLLVMLEPWKGIGRKWAIIACYVMAVPLDIFIDPITQVVRDTYIYHATTIMTFWLTLSPFVRPLIIETVAIALACVTIREVWEDIRYQRWAGRSRFRHDHPLLPLVRRPLPPRLAQTERIEDLSPTIDH